jgi:hypothetical protein
VTRPNERGDRFPSIYLFVFLPFVGVRWLYWLAPKWDWGTTDFVIFVMTPLVTAGLLIIDLARWRWRRVLSLLAAPFLLLALFRLLAVVGVTPDRVRFALTEHAYLAEIRRIDVPSTEPRFKTFEWDSTFVAKTYSTLVHDESDEIALPAGDQSATWQQRNQKLCSERNRDCVNLAPDSDEYITVRKIGDHFYILDDSFPNAFP